MKYWKLYNFSLRRSVIRTKPFQNYSPLNSYFTKEREYKLRIRQNAKYVCNKLHKGRLMRL